MDFDMYIKHMKRWCENNGHKQYFEDLTHRVYDSSDEYVIMDTLRNFLVHEDDVINYIGVNEDGPVITSSKEILLNGINLSASKKKVLLRQKDDIDLINVINISFDNLSYIHDQYINFFINNKLIKDLEFLEAMSKKTVMINAEKWYILKETSFESIKSKKHPISRLATGFDYIELPWKTFHRLYFFIQKQQSLSNSEQTVSTSIKDYYHDVFKPFIGRNI